MQNNPDTMSAESIAARRELYEQVAAAFKAEGTQIDASLEALMKPLLDGTMTYEEHRVLLETLLRESAE